MLVHITKSFRVYEFSNLNDALNFARLFLGHGIENPGKDWTVLI